MILSVSRRTDIPAFYSEWFFNRIKEGFVYVRNPLNIHMVSRVPLTPELIDCIVFWSKNPAPMLDRLDELKGYMYYFQYTINPYNKSMECNVPQKHDGIETFQRLSDKIGPKRVIWRYDPILFTESMDMNYHIQYFEEIAKRLKGYTNTCVISFVDLYKKTQRNLKDTTARELTINEMMSLAGNLFNISQKYGMTIQTCAEDIALEQIGIEHGRCIDDVLIEDLLGVKLVVAKDGNQRKECGCVQSIDIGEYNTCGHCCKYCYANFDNNVVAKNRQFHNPKSPLLIGELKDNDKVVDRKIFTFIKTPEPLQNGDFVKLEHPEKYPKDNETPGRKVNVYKIKSIDKDSVKLENVSIKVPLEEIKPIGIDGVEDRWIYYDPYIAASISFDDSVKTCNVNYTYYMEKFDNCFIKGKNYRQIIEKKKLRYVHEVQHWLKDATGQDGLKVKES